MVRVLAAGIVLDAVVDGLLPDVVSRQGQVPAAVAVGFGAWPRPYARHQAFRSRRLAHDERLAEGVGRRWPSCVAA